MAGTAAFCTDCRRYVWLTPEGGCENGHPRPALRDVRQVDSLPTGPVMRETRPIVGTDTIAFGQPGGALAGPKSAKAAAKAAAGKPAKPRWRLFGRAPVEEAPAAVPFAEAVDQAAAAGAPSLAPHVGVDR